MRCPVKLVGKIVKRLRLEGWTLPQRRKDRNFRSMTEKGNWSDSAGIEVGTPGEMMAECLDGEKQLVGRHGDSSACSSP